jgi:hypothetical protein
MATEQTPHLFDDASEDELLGFSRSDLSEYAADRGVAHAGKLTKAKLVAALLELRASGTLPDDEERPAENEADDSDDKDEPEAITPDEARKFEGAPDETIEDWLDRHRDARQCLRDFAELTLAKRRAAKAKQSAVDAMKSDLGYYRVTKGGRLCLGGLWTMLPAGSCVTEATHNLADLRAQGFELEPVREVRVTENYAGMSVMAIDVE